MAMSKEELLRALDDIFYGYAIPENIHEQQAYEQIRQLIENQPKVDEELVEKWAKIIGTDLCHYIKANLIDMLKEVCVIIK